MIWRWIRAFFTSKKEIVDLRTKVWILETEVRNLQKLLANETKAT